MPRRCGRQTTRANHPADTPKTVLESFFVHCVYRPHDNGIGVASDKIRKSLLIVNMIHKMVSIEGYSTWFTASSVSQSEIGIWSRGVILQRVRYRAISLLNSSKLHARSVWYVSHNVAICSFVIFPITVCWKKNKEQKKIWKTGYQSQSPCRHAKTVLESFFVLCVYRPHDNGWSWHLIARCYTPACSPSSDLPLEFV
jgi:hypothetical protein